MTASDQAKDQYAPVPAQLDLPTLDQGVLTLWDDRGIFTKSWRATADGPRWNFYEGPPTANGTPGTHHIEARAFKDVFPRFKTMQGYRVDRRGGWDCHGLPVELAVEAELGFDHKNEIEQYGVEAFNQKCRESVSRYVGEFAELTHRMGYWVNLDEAYWTLKPEYIDSEWWALQQIFDKGLLVEEYRVTPFCPHDETTLSDHEVSQGYETITDPSVFIRMPLVSGPWTGAALLVWTTTPWTLISNTAVAVNPEVTYVLASDGTERLVLAEQLLDKVLGEGWRVLDRCQGTEMERWHYRRPYDMVSFDGADANFVLLAGYVTTDDGTGLVHEAPAFGADDMATCREYGLPTVNPVRRDGTFDPELPLVGGLFFRDANDPIIADLRDRGLLHTLLPYEHAYPFCWRCHSPLIYYAVPSWYIRTTARKDDLLASNQATTWYPETVKWGRYGDWLNHNIDWALSRSRYWGTPLPVWRNELDPSKLVCVGSRAELAQLSGRPEVATMDPHRPFVDDVTFQLPGVEGTYRRVPEVIDAWFDSGSMPFAQWGYPWVEGSDKDFHDHFPADYICEAADQTRGWFYTLMVNSTLLFGQNSYRNVVCLGHILAEDGRKMSKHLGNILLPIPLLDEHGADAVRWFMMCAGSPWAARRVSPGTLQEVVRKVLLTYWNTVSFQALYARANGWTPTGTPPPLAERGVLDRWLASATQRLIQGVTQRLEDFDTQHAGSLLAAFIDDLSNWYVRRSRRRFWEGDPAALWTLHETLDALTRLMAPITPFITERVWQDLFVASGSADVESVHLAKWPVADESLLDDSLEAAMVVVRKLVELGRSARAEAKVKTRQPLSRALISAASDALLSDELREQICQELNVEAVGTFAQAGDVVDHVAKANFRALGRRFGQQTPVVAAAVSSADAGALAAALHGPAGTATLDVPGVGEVSLTSEDVLLTERPRAGWSVLEDAGETIALDLELTPELVSAGLARDVVRAVQEARKASGFDVSDRIRLVWTACEQTAVAVRTHAGLIGNEVLAADLAEDPGLGGDGVFTEDDLGLRFTVARVDAGR